MAQPSDLYFQEAILLLALRDDTGTVATGSHDTYAIGGALLAELFLQEHIRVDEGDRKHLVDPAPIGDGLLDECLQRIGSAKRRASLQSWVAGFAGLKNLKHRVAEPLCARGILRAEHARVLLLFSIETFPEANPEPERQLVRQMRAAITSDAQEIDARTAVLISLANGADLLAQVVDKATLRERRARIKQISNGELTGRATKEAIAAMQTAVMVAAIIPAIVVTTTGN